MALRLHVSELLSVGRSESRIYGTEMAGKKETVPKAVKFLFGGSAGFVLNIRESILDDVCVWVGLLCTSLEARPTTTSYNATIV